VGAAYPEAQKLRAERDMLIYVPGFPDVSPKVRQVAPRPPSIVESAPKPKGGGISSSSVPELISATEPEPVQDLLEHMKTTLSQADWFNTK
jgi:hypothetical protein